MARVHEAGTAEAWKSQIAAAAEHLRPAEPLDGPLVVIVTFYMPRPKRLMRKSDREGAVWFQSKPDCDNLAKSALDCLTELRWWGDDSQVASLLINKCYHAKGGLPGMVMIVDRMPSDGPCVETKR